MRLTITSIVIIAALAACAPTSSLTTVSGGEATLNSRADASFTGQDGPAWTDDELRNNAFRVLCQIGTPTDLVITRRDDGSASFSGWCV